jgi:hypothetical protein
MRILIVNPKSESRNPNQLDFRFMTGILTPRGYRGGTSVMGCIPLALPTLAALTPAGIEVEVLDEHVQKLSFHAKPDIVAITCITLSSRRAYAIADAFRAKGAHVALGGIHVSLFPDEAAKHADAVFIGEAEETWPCFIEDFRAGKPFERYDAIKYPTHDKLVVPRWDLADNRFYLSRHVQTGQGCAFDCDFYGVRAFLGVPHHKPIANVIREIEASLQYNTIPGMRQVLFADDNIASDALYACELFKALIPLNVKWTSRRAWSRSRV